MLFRSLFADKLITRGVEHDRLKLESPEVEIFTEFTPKLEDLHMAVTNITNFLRK